MGGGVGEGVGLAMRVGPADADGSGAGCAPGTGDGRVVCAPAQANAAKAIVRAMGAIARNGFNLV